MTFTEADYALINLGVCIRGQADRLGIEHRGVPLEGVVVRIATAALTATTEPEYEYGASPHISPSRVRAIQDGPFDVSLFRSRPSMSHGDWVPDTLVYRTKAGPWEPVPDTNERNEKA